METTTQRGERVALRALESGDLDRCLRWVNAPSTRHRLSTVVPFSRDAEREWLEKASRPLRPNPTDLALAIEAGGVHVGTVMLHGIDLVHRHAEAGIAIGEPEARGRGIGRAAWELLIRYAFAELNLEVLRAEVYEQNEPSVRLQLACGYTLVGRLPRWAFKGGQYQDVLVYALTRDAWAARQSS